MPKALVIDDDVPTTEVLKAKVNWGALGVSEVFCAYNMHDAWEIFNVFSPKLLLCDIEMPQGSGLDLIRRVRESGSSAKFIFITCHADFSYATQALDYEASAYITKPLDIPRIEEAISKAMRAIGKMPEAQTPEALKDPLALKIEEYIGEHYMEDVTRGALAAYLFMSPNHLSKVFKEKMGSGIADYLSEVRIEKSKALLSSPFMSVSEVAAKVGIGNVAYFSTLFRKITGESPTDFRRNATKSVQI
ncbi:MAG: helix-turn-helix domain-containing protein [Clostridiales bacterium]|jgi:YesN/AraC family two-component response regulator|nr:helix-turn-helix domain-containing protein [Clostridiales bacterium]MDR2749891.1 helix-turn-helix domain-containing protein [Clostridiales bacterium]